ncbi:MAG TPA: uroporphyrinogen-III synthase [Rhizomicrobium sp.]|jgi:uroporphyrinogen-III synthase|nr:uroporphyrinogen-III synthase [Rhizomicrobium sp.]
MAPLGGLKILVPESRELDLFAGMLEAEGAVVLRCPMVQILDLDNSTDAEAWIEMLIGDALQDVIWLTGEGIRRLMPIAARIGRDTAFVSALEGVRNITRGPKPARALRELGISLGPTPREPTSQGVIDMLAPEDIANRSIGVQLYPGTGCLPLLDHLRSRGANVFAVVPYRYASDAETSQVVGTIGTLAAGGVDLVAFTATPQIERLFEVARGGGLERQLREGFARTVIAAVGPVVEETLRAFGLASSIRPDNSFHLKPLVRAIVAWRAA